VNDIIRLVGSGGGRSLNRGGTSGYIKSPEGKGTAVTWLSSRGKQEGDASGGCHKVVVKWVGNGGGRIIMKYW